MISAVLHKALLSWGPSPWGLMLCSHCLEIILSFHLCFADEIQQDNRTCTLNLESWLMYGPAIHMFSSLHMPSGPPHHPSLLLPAVTIHHLPQQGPNVRVRRVSTEGMKHWLRPESMSQPGQAFHTLPVQVLSTSQHQGLKIPVGCLSAKDLGETTPWGEEVFGSTSPDPAPCMPGYSTAHLVENQEQPTAPGRIEVASVGLYLAHRYACAQGHSLTGAMLGGSSLLPCNPLKSGWSHYLEFYHPSLCSAMPVLNANIRVLN